MSTLYAALISLVGDVPAGCEPYVYIFCCIMVLWLANMICTLISAMFASVLK